MEIKQVSPSFWVSPQIACDDIAKLQREGFATIICNRPDGEEAGQPAAQDIAAEAAAAGIAFHHIPVAGGAFPPDAVAAFAAARRTATGPTLAFCRTGTRSITLDALANVDGLDAETVIGRAARAGYDLSALRDAIAADNRSSGEYQ